MTAVLVVYLLAVARITLWPDFADPQAFDALRTAVAWLDARGVPVTYAGVEATANVVMFMPFGVLVGLLASARHRWQWLVVAAGCATSATIETCQLLFLPTRVPSLQDVAMNTLGAGVGVLCLVVAHRHVARRARLT